MCSSASATCNNSTASSMANQSTDELVAQQASVTRAEIIWVLRVVKNHHSFHSCFELGDDMKDMFPNSDTVSKIILSKTKCAYFVTHGVAPCVKSNLQTEVSNSPFFLQ